jgi:hypothetical protein
MRYKQADHASTITGENKQSTKQVSVAQTQSYET